MEAESSKLTALQTQQQLAVQSLSIANSSSQSILSLFRG
jgi:flagellin